MLYREIPKKINLDKEEFNKLSVAAVKYACGRASYVPSVIAGILSKNIDYLDEDSRKEILDYISKRDFKDALGWDCDKETWYSLRDRINESSYDSSKEFEFKIDLDTFWLFVGSAFRHDKASEEPELKVSEYESLVRRNEEILNEKWVQNLLNDVVEAFGVNWIMEVGPQLDREGFLSFDSYLRGLYEKMTEDRKFRNHIPEIPRE